MRWMQLLVAGLCSLGCNSADGCHKAQHAQGQAGSEASSVHQASHLEVFEPPASPSDARDVIVFLHGLGDTPNKFADAAAFILPDMNARRVFVRAPLEYFGGRGWFMPYRPLSSPDQATLAVMKSRMAELRALLQKLKAKHAGHVGVLGFSQGAMLSYALLMHYPELVDVAWVVAGWLPEPLRAPSGVRDPAKKLPQVYVFHGMQDSLVAFGLGKQSAEAMRAANYPVEFFSYSRADHEIPPAMAADLRARVCRWVECEPYAR